MMLQRASKYLGYVSNALSVIGGVAVLTMLAHIVADVAMRNIMNIALPATVEVVSRYYMVAAAFLPLAWVERTGGMITVDFLTGVLGRRGVKISDVGVGLTSIVVYAFLTYSTWLVAIAQFNRSSFIVSMSVAIPVWPTYFILPVSFALATIICVLRTVLVVSDGAANVQTPEENEA